MKTRALTPFLLAALKEKMLFLGGPRQVGKTVLSLQILGTESVKHPAYLNWDAPGVAKKLKNAELPPHQKIIVLDEIHKFHRWRNLVKGLYDTNRDHLTFLVTGSARLDYYRKGGDSLQGRYNYFRLHPFTLDELKGNHNDLKNLIQFGGFPEPFLNGSERSWRLWQRERMTRVIREDLRDLENVREVSLMEELVELLPHKVGSPLSINSIREDLNIDHGTAERWVTILENLYICYRILPYGTNKFRAVKKERKLYMWDWSQVQNNGARFENLVASHLLKFCHLIEDTEGYKMELRFIRDRDGRELDFVILKDNKPIFGLECKSGETNIHKNTHYFAERTPIPQIYQVHQKSKNYINGKIHVLPFEDFCTEALKKS